MKLLKWLEAHIYFGEVIKDYGCVSDRKVGIVRERTSLLLCKHQGRLQLVVRNSYSAVFGWSVQYSYIPAASVSVIKKIADEVEQTLRDYGVT